MAKHDDESGEVSRIPVATALRDELDSGQGLAKAVDGADENSGGSN